MLRFSLKKLNLFVSVVFLFLLIYQNQVNASRVDASKFGFNATDATTALKTALAQAVDTVIIPNMGTDWIITTIVITGASGSNKTIIFEKGVVVTAKKLASFGYLFDIKNVSNVSLIGYGATLKMQKADYMNPALYGFSEWRHCIGISTGTNIKILGLILRDSGGDGIAIMYNSKGILIKDVICDNNYRQGMSAIYYTNLTIENCVMINTGGTSPQSGIDFEPNGRANPDAPYNTQINGKMLNCYFGNNKGDGITVAYFYLDNGSPAVSLDIKHCFMSDGLKLYETKNGGVKGTVSFEDCIVEGVESPRDGALKAYGKLAKSYLAKFTTCLVQNANPAIAIMPGYPTWGNIFLVGEMQFNNCTINEPDNQPTIKRSVNVANITGNIKVNCPYGAQSNLAGTNVTVQLTEIKSKPPVVTSVIPDKGKPAKVTHFTAGNAISISAVAYDPDNGTANGAGISKVDFALWRGDGIVASFSDASAPYAWPLTTTKTYGGIYLIRITAYSKDGSYTVACVPVYIYNPAGSGGTGIPGPGIELNHEVWNGLSGNEFLVRNSSKGFLVYSPFSQDSRIVISDLSGRQVTMHRNIKGNSWNNISTKDKFSNNVYFIQVTDSKGNNSIVRKAMMAR
jgi:antitoxin component YwqK of YwqJK toxin-antitoxin module